MKWLQIKEQRLKLLADQEGYILGLVMVFFVVFSILGLGFINMGSHERIHAFKDYHREKAYYYASSGIHKGLWRINKVSKAAGTFSDSTVSVVYDSVGLTLTATGTSGTAQKIIQVTFEETANEPIGGWPYALYTDTKKLRLDEGMGTITGDVHSNYSVAFYESYVVNGTITTSPYVAPPTIDWNFFKTEAQNGGQYSTSTLVFDAAGSPYTGVWYTTSHAHFQANAVINGTVVAEDKIYFEGDDITITATPSNYPVLLCKDQIEGAGGNYDNVQITGLVYTDEHFDKDFDNFTLTGAIIAGENFHHYSTIFVVTYDANYTTNVAGTDIGGAFVSPTYTIKTWQEL